MIYKALIQPYFDYCSAVWGSIGVGQSERLQKPQNRAARLITFSDFKVRSSSFLGDLGWCYNDPYSLFSEFPKSLFTS